MYENFFGFHEKPFKLVPNPAYLFLGRSHEEALAHLNYAARQGEGFVAVIGEVGTGKTTLCRSFLENLDEDTVAAFIFNPKLGAVQLLKAINDEFAIDTVTNDPKLLIDALNAFLLEQKSNNKTVILLIDEAQNLDRDVLEQIRLISNLETTSDKLIQIILVGQPELIELLESHELRQLGQRIALRSHLEPLAYHETLNYIQHRLIVASGKPGLKFSSGAYRQIYKYSGGLPRLINIVCDRALLIAFGLNQARITKGIAKLAIRELGTGKKNKKSNIQRIGRLSAIGGLFCLIAILMQTFLPSIAQIDITNAPLKADPQPGKAIASPAKAEIVSSPKDVQTMHANETTTSAESHEVSLSELLNTLSPRESRREALVTLFDLWGMTAEKDIYLENVDDNNTYFSLAARRNGLTVERVSDDMDRIKHLNLPVILEFPAANGMDHIYMTLTQVKGKSGDHLTLRCADRVIDIRSEELFSHWSGIAYLPWKNFLNLSGIIPTGNSKESVATLKLHLRDIGFENIAINPFYDSLTRKAVESIQRKHRLEIDGLVGSDTKIALYNESKKYNIPHILNPVEQGVDN